jgi:hypothetical protein
MSRRIGGRPRHNLSTFVIVLKKTSAEEKDRQCVCKACFEVLKDNAKSMTNRKERIKKHLETCEHFWKKYGEEAEEILKSCDSDNDNDEVPPEKRICLDDG